MNHSKPPLEPAPRPRKSRQVVVRIEDDLHDQIEAHAADLQRNSPGLHVSFAGAMRDLVVKGLERTAAPAPRAARARR